MSLQEPTKHLIDVGAGGITLAALFEVLPEITALLSALWVLIRIWETETVRGIVKRFRRDR